MAAAIGLILMLSSGAAYSQTAAPTKLPGQYKRVHQNALRQIIRGDAATAVEELERLLERLPNDAESLYMLTVANANLGQLEEAARCAKRALAAGLPASRFAGGTRTGLESLTDMQVMREIAEQFADQPVHGPMLGCLTGESVSVWVRTAGEADVRVIASPKSDPQVQIRSETVRSQEATDFTAVVPLRGLTPNTSYLYWVRINGGPELTADNARRFHTLAAQGQPGKFRIAFGGGAGFVPPNERVWTTISKQNPDALLLLGDNVYIDDPKSPEMQHYCYYRRQSRPEFRALVATTPVFSIWDDHDFGTNDCSGGPEINDPAWKQPVYNVFCNNWVNPYYGGGQSHPGCYYDFYLADVHFIMLDGRYYRNLKTGPDKPTTMLGPVQRTWLLDTIADSQGRFLVLCSPVPWVFEAKGDSRDTWNGFREERKLIFDCLAENDRAGVLLMSADRHRSDLWKIERADRYPLYEFNSSRLTNQHVHKEMEKAVFSYNKTQSFGTVDFDTSLEDPAVTYRIWTIDGEEVNSVTLQLSQLGG